jgi:hypothetical protein
MPSHIFVRLGLWDETVSANWRSYQAGVDYAKALGRTEVAPHEFHALDYAVYGDLQRGRDSAAMAAVALARSISTSGNANTLIGGYNGTAMQARIPLERSDWKAAAAFPVVQAPDVPLVTALAHFTRGIGAARSGGVAEARADVVALDSIAGLLAARDAYWARVVGIKRDAVRAWVLLADGDTAGAVALARATADLEDVTDKHPVTPAELLPARELEADLLLLVGRYGEARASYEATLVREPGRARSTFGAARAAELASERSQATVGYRAYLELMSGGDGTRPEMEIAQDYLARVAAARG